MQTTNPLERMRGLIGRPPLSHDEGLLIKPCSSVHTFGMCYPIDLIFLSKDWQIRKLVSTLQPYRMVWVANAYMVVEIMAGTLDKLKLTQGLTLKWEETTCV
ncbi:MAG: DUF192 domain-containing protein [Gammaproteobacteria bacterium]|nr:DUF192 domain-containing protein [Gammaproteobacteria bacterium]